jgi:glycogen operon protein
MLLHGDEIGRTQRGNNNAYAQDNELSWMDWENADQDLLAFTRRLVQLMMAHPVFRRRKWFLDSPIRGSGVTDIGWFTPGGEPMSDQRWAENHARSLGVFLNGRGIRTPDDHGQPVSDDSFYLLFNAHDAPVAFKIPESDFYDRWVKVLDTDQPSPDQDAETYQAGDQVMVAGRSLVVLCYAE